MLGPEPTPEAEVAEVARVSRLNGRAGQILGGGGLGAAVLMAAVWQVDSLRDAIRVAQKEAETAIQVAAQHGAEFNEVRRSIRELQGEIADLRAQANLGGRFTREDGDRLERWIRRLEEMKAAEPKRKR